MRVTAPVEANLKNEAREVAEPERLYVAVGIEPTTVRGRLYEALLMSSSRTAVLLIPQARENFANSLLARNDSRKDECGVSLPEEIPPHRPIPRP